MQINNAKVKQTVEVDGYAITVTKEEVIALKAVLGNASGEYIDRAYKVVYNATTDVNDYRVVNNMYEYLDHHFHLVP